MTEALADKVAIVTGAGRGIGRAISVMLAGEGARVAAAARTEADLMELMADVDAARGEPGERVLIVPTDLRDENAIRHLVARTREAFGRLDLLINNAGVAVNKPLAETSTEDWDLLMAVNARAPFLLCREALPLMKASGGGCIVNIASVVGVKGYVDQAAYTASKHALVGMTKVLAQEAKADGIRVHAVCPGGVATDMVKRMRPDIDGADLMQPEEIAEIVLFLLTRTGNAVVDQVNVRRAASAPWF